MKTAASRLIPFALLVAILLTSAGPVAATTPAVPSWRTGIPWTTETATVTFERDAVEAQLADTGQLRTRGLGYRDGLAPGTAMLFVYDEPAVLTFWMKGMRFCLDIVWIEDGEIKGAAESVCPEPGVTDGDMARYASPEPVRYVLEVPAGWLDEHGYETGDPVDIALPED